MSYVNFKEVTTNSVGTAAKFGGKDLNEVMQILNGLVVANRRPKILNEWIFLDHFDLKAPAGTPSAPTDTNTNRLYTDPLDFKLKARKTGGTIIDMENIDIPSSALQTISDKTKLHAQIGYKDETNWVTDAIVSTHISTKISITAKGQLNSSIAYEDEANTFGDFNNIFRSSRLQVTNPANTFNYSIVGSAITAARNVTLPLLTANDQVTCDAFPTTLTSKTVNITNNTITATTQALGDIIANDGSKFIRKPRGTSLQVLRVNSAGTDIEYASLDSERVGKSTASGNASTTVFNIAHGLGSNPTYAFISVAQSGSAFIGTQYTTDATNIIVTFASAPASGTNNVIIYWRVVA